MIYSVIVNMLRSIINSRNSHIVNAKHRLLTNYNKYNYINTTSSLFTCSNNKNKCTEIYSHNFSNYTRFPSKQGLYDSTLEKDSCGVGLVANMKKLPSRKIVLDANQMLVRMSHRGGCGCEENAGDGAGDGPLLYLNIYFTQMTTCVFIHMYIKYLFC